MRCRMQHALAPLFVAAALALTGCGGSNSASSSLPPSGSASLKSFRTQTPHLVQSPSLGAVWAVQGETLVVSLLAVGPNGVDNVTVELYDGKGNGAGKARLYPVGDSQWEGDLRVRDTADDGVYYVEAALNDGNFYDDAEINQTLYQVDADVSATNYTKIWNFIEIGSESFRIHYLDTALSSLRPVQITVGGK